MPRGLAIGGSRDGQWLTAQDGCSHIAVVNSQPLSITEAPTEAITVNYDLYWLEMLIASDEKFWFWRHHSLTLRELIATLMTGYRKP